MSREVVILKNTVFSYREESVVGTAPSDSDNTAIVLVRTDTPATWTLGREILETRYMNGVLGRNPPQIGMYNEDIGYVIPVFARGAGTQGVAPDYSLLLKHTMGGLNAPTGGVVAAAPTSTDITVTGGSGWVVGDIARIEYNGAAGGSYAIRRVTDVSGGNALTLWPPLPDSGLAAGGDVQAGVTHLLKSDPSDFSTGSGFFYFDGDKKDVFTGCMGSNLAINWEVGQRIDMQFTMQAINYAYSETAIGYTVVPSDYVTTTPIMCLGIELDIYYSATVVTGSTATDVILTSTGGLEIEATDEVIVYVDASSDYETRTPSVVAGSGIGNKTVTVSALSGAPSAGNAAYIRHTECLPSLSVTLENILNKDMCMHVDSGYTNQAVTDRNIDFVADNARWRTILERYMRDNVVGFELRAIGGDTAGNIFVMWLPNAYYGELPRGEDAGKITQAWNGWGTVDAGNDELIIAHL